MTLRIAVIGAGVMGGDHAKIIAQNIPGASLHVLCDADHKRAVALGETLGADDVANDALETVTRTDVDAVIIASPDDTHADLTIAAINAGKPVLCEKPLAPTSSACLRIIDAECSLGKQMIWVGFMRRFDPSYSAIKAVIDGGEIGAAIMMHNFHRNVSAPEWFTGQMAVSNSAPHEFDIARHLLGTQVTYISAFQGKSDTAIAPVMMVLETANSQLVTVEVNNGAAYGYDVRCEMVGTNGSVDLGAPFHARVNTKLKASEPYAKDWRPRFADAYRLQNNAWVTSIVTGRPDPRRATAWDGYWASKIAESGVQALQNAEKVRIEFVEKPELYS